MEHAEDSALNAFYWIERAQFECRQDRVNDAKRILRTAMDHNVQVRNLIE
jgi:hypothetical protein